MSPGVLLCGARDAVGRLIDLATGRSGWSHVAWATGRRGRDGAELAIDIDHRRGVVWSTVRAVVEGRRAVRIAIDGDAWAVESRLRARIGEPYSHVAMMLQPLQLGPRGAYCSRVLAEALPVRLRLRLPRLPSPADFEVLCSPPP